MLSSVLLSVAAASASPQISEPPTFVMSIDDSGRAVCAGPTDQQKIMIWDHLERLREEETLGLDLDFLVDSSENVTLKFRGVPRSAREAIWHAMDLWYEKLEIDIPFTLMVYWEEFEENEDEITPLAFARSYWDDDEKEGSWACYGFLDWGCLPKPLANQKAGFRLAGDTDPDPEFEIHINSGVDWYLGTDGRPSRYEFDLVTVILHELGHALGFSTGLFPDHERKMGRGIFTDSKYSVYYDHFAWTRDEGDIVDLLRPSDDLYNALTGNRLFWGRNGMENLHEEPLLSLERNGGPVMLWAVSTTTSRTGQVVSHLDEYAFPDSHQDSLMSPFISPGRAKHRLGPVTLGMLYDLGWDLNGYTRDRTPNPPAPPPTPEPDFNPDAAEAWVFGRMIGSAEGSRSSLHEGILVHASGVSYGLFDVHTDGVTQDRLFGLLLRDRIDVRSTDVHMKADNRWVPYLKLIEKNQPVPEDLQELPGVRYFNTVEIEGNAFTAFTQTRETIELHIHFSGDSRRTVLTFPLRVPIQ